MAFSAAQQLASSDAPEAPDAPAISIVIAALDEAPTVAQVIEGARGALTRLQLSHEFIVADGGSRDATCVAASSAGARVLQSAPRPYGESLRAGLGAARGEFILTLDCDGSHDPEALAALWDRRAGCDLVIASRYAKGGGSDASRYRRALSAILNWVFRGVLRLPQRDCSSGFRLYRRAALANLPLQARDFDIQEEILARLHAAHGVICEVPFHYHERHAGESHARLSRCAPAYAATLWRMARLRAVQK